MHYLSRKLFLFVAMGLTASACFAQVGESTEILGIVQDSTGAVVPGVEVTATHIATNQSRIITTGESGTYVFTAMQPGEYNIKAVKDGFRTEVRTGLVLQLKISRSFSARAVAFHRRRDARQRGRAEASRRPSTQRAQFCVSCGADAGCH
jgi:hypothetical protein